MSYKGEFIWIIGASSGIGCSLAKELASQGAHLILSARREQVLNDLMAELSGDGHIVAPVDVSDDALLSSIAASLGRLDRVVFMAASYEPHSEQPKDIKTIHQMISVNLGGAYNVVNAVLEKFKAQGFGQIALCGSVAGYRGLPYGQPYCSTKAGVINYAESLKIELEDQGIDVKVISPGFVKTPLTDKNDFPMPMMIEADEAGRVIAKQLLSRRFEIHFPWRFTMIMKVIDVLPRFIYFPISRLMKKQQ